MIIVCPTVPHTGTHFMRELLLEAEVDRVVLVHPYPDQVDELRQLFLEGAVCIIPVRDPARVFCSWIKYGKNPDDYAGHSLDEWMAIQADLALEARAYYLHIDKPGVRDLQLEEINRELGLDLVTDWEPVRQAGPTNGRDQIAQQFIGQ